MTEHPAKGCTKHQIAAFERIAVGDDTMLADRTRDALEAKGLIEVYTEIIGQNWPRVTIKRAFVPTPVHAQWCAWCAEQPDGGA